MNPCAEIKLPPVVTDISNAVNSHCQIAQHCEGSVVVVVAHECGDIARAVVPDPVPDTGQELRSLTSITTGIATVLEWTAGPQAIAIDAQRLTPSFTIRQCCNFAISDGI